MSRHILFIPYKVQHSLNFNVVSKFTHDLREEHMQRVRKRKSYKLEVKVKEIYFVLEWSGFIY